MPYELFALLLLLPLLFVFQKLLVLPVFGERNHQLFAAPKTCLQRVTHIFVAMEKPPGNRLQVRKRPRRQAHPGTAPTRGQISTDHRSNTEAETDAI
jgi:hypothetical protein